MEQAGAMSIRNPRFCTKSIADRNECNECGRREATDVLDRWDCDAIFKELVVVEVTASSVDISHRTNCRSSSANSEHKKRVSNRYCSCSDCRIVIDVVVDYNGANRFTAHHRQSLPFSADPNN